MTKTTLTTTPKTVVTTTTIAPTTPKTKTTRKIAPTTPKTLSTKHTPVTKVVLPYRVNTNPKNQNNKID